MPRTLPWLKHDQQTGSKTPSKYAEPKSKKRSRAYEDDERAPRPSREVVRGPRTPSTSPPPAPPDVEFMRDGDHEWIMVEDEYVEAQLEGES